MTSNSKGRKTGCAFPSPPWEKNNHCLTMKTEAKNAATVIDLSMLCLITPHLKALPVAAAFACGTPPGESMA